MPQTYVCPVCRSENLKPIKNDGTLAFRCEKGHLFVINKTDGKENKSLKSRTPK
jgi:hypothetical protein